MTVKEMSEQISLRILTGGDSLDEAVTGCYIGDLLSWVMGRAQSGDAWLTVMGNINAVAVAALADTACIVLTENAQLDEEARQKAEEQGIVILQSEENAYRLAVKLSGLLS